MKFAYSGSDLSKIIKKFTYNDNRFHIEYFDGSKCDYYCSEENHAEKVKEMMVDQARDRQEKMAVDLTKNKTGEIMILYMEVIILFGLQDSIKNSRDFMTFLCAMIIILTTTCEIQSLRERREFKKFAMFLEMYDKLDEVNKTEFMKCIEYEPFYQKRLDIDTIDDFSLGDIKTLYRKLNEE